MIWPQMYKKGGNTKKAGPGARLRFLDFVPAISEGAANMVKW